MDLIDPHKKTSISQLLNPEVASGRFHDELPGALDPNQAQENQENTVIYAGQCHNSSSYNLRAADWTNMSEDATKRKQSEHGQTISRHYPQMNNAADSYQQPQASRLLRASRGDEHAYFAMDSQSWQTQGVVTASYNRPLITPMYSDERTALSGDFPRNDEQAYHEHSNFSRMQSTTWQNAERVSVRLAARGTVPGVHHESETSENRYIQDWGFHQPAYESPMNHETTSAPRQDQRPEQCQVPQKRVRSEPEALPPKSKRKPNTKTKTKATKDGTAGPPSKRGYHAKKRTEAAEIAAQNAQLTNNVAFSPAPAVKGKEREDYAPIQVLAAQDPDSPGASGNLHPELQFARCMSNRYRNEDFPRCVSCTRRWAGDTCRFQGIRFLMKDSQRNIVGVSFIETQKADTPTMNFPTKWNVPLIAGHIRRTKTTIARALLPVLHEEHRHLNMDRIIRRPRESEVRATCDTCMTSIFSCSWMCRLCGREACADCFTNVSEFTAYRPGASQAEIADTQARREKHAQGNPFFLSCTKRNEHNAKDFSPMSRFHKEELAQAIKEMEALLKDEESLSGGGATVGSGTGSLRNPDDTGAAPVAGPSTLQGEPSNGYWPHAPQQQTPVSTTNGLWHPDHRLPLSSNANATNGAAVASATPDTAVSTDTGGTPSHTMLQITDSELTEVMFQSIWAKGEPLVVNNILPKFKIQWTPGYFIEKYAAQTCLITECQTDASRRVTVGEFFRGFGKYEERTGCWKLKDWPPSTDFKSAFPELFEDFSQAVPIPNYVRRDGVMNLASHFPSNAVYPDLGPKMYNANGSFMTAGSKGSTRLHMDMADALNVMTYAAPTAGGAPGSAVWDLFRAEDSDKIREFLRQRFQGQFANDPIHGQTIYLDEELRHALWEEHGVKSWRFYQKPGDAVFIPAGCAHQVCNMSDCIKVAIDFVSPENIERCEKLTREFREQNQRKAWKEDVLQLRTMMWFAWLSCCLREQS